VQRVELREVEDVEEVDEVDPPTLCELRGAWVGREEGRADADEEVELGGVGSAMRWVVLGLDPPALCELWRAWVGGSGVDPPTLCELLRAWVGAEGGIWAGTDFCRPVGTK